MKRKRLRAILQIAADLTQAGGQIDVSRMDRAGSGGEREEQAWELEIRAIAKKGGVEVREVFPCAIREDQQKRIADNDVDLLLAEMPSNVRANKPFVRDLRWLRDNSNATPYCSAIAASTRSRNN